MNDQPPADNAPAFQLPLTHVLITGASAGLGLELARLFAADGHPLVLVARSEEKLKSLAQVLCKDFEVDVRVIKADLAAPHAVTDLLKALQDAQLGIRILVNNAAFGSYGLIVDREIDVYQRMIDLNVNALTGLTRGLLPAMLACAASGDPIATQRGQPGIMNVASTAAFQPGPLMAVYFATKSYVLSFTEALHEEVMDQGVRVTTFCPGPTRTEFHRQQDMVPAGDVSEQQLAEYNQRDAKRMDAGSAALMGYRAFQKGRAIVIPGFKNRILAQAGRFLPRSVVRRVAMRMLKAD